MYAVTGGHFVYGSRITYSFVPDGTPIGGFNSNLYATMDAKFPRADWQRAFAAAAATWERYANVNLVESYDNGAPLGSTNYQQGDPYVGDIRIAGYPQGNSTLAWAFAPPQANGGPVAGDILINTSQLWNIGSIYDLQTVVTHELGHSLGLGHSSVRSAEMFAYYDGIRQSLTTDDINGIQAVWGPRVPDWTTTNGGNYTRDTAFNLNPYINTANNQLVLPNLDITDISDDHWFKIVTPANASSTLVATMQATNLSMLIPRIQIYDASGRGLSEVYGAKYAYSSTVSVKVTNATPNTTYYIHTLPAYGTTGSAGAYALEVNMGYASLGLAGPPNTTVGIQPDQGAANYYETVSEERQKSGRNRRNKGADEIPETITIGTLTGFGDDLKATRKYQKKAAQNAYRVAQTHPKLQNTAFKASHRRLTLHA